MASEELIRALAAAHAVGDKVMKQTQPLAEMRAVLDAAVAAREPDPTIDLRDVDAGGVPAVWVTPRNVTSDLIILFFHGGAYVKGNVAASHTALAMHCRALGARALSVDYRVAPEHPFPAALEDAQAAYRHLLAAGHPAGKIVFNGSSAGGGLALALLVSCRDAGLPLPAAVVGISPWADLTQSGDSALSLAERDPALTKPYLDRFAADYAGGADLRLPTISPVFADHAALGVPILMQVGTEEILLDDARRVVENARQAGHPARLEVYDKGYHGWQGLGEGVPEARQAAENAAAFLREYLSVPA